MNPATPKTCYNHDSLSFRLHEQARRHRSRAIAAGLLKLIAKLKLSLPVPAQLQIARWG